MVFVKEVTNASPSILYYSHVLMKHLILDDTFTSYDKNDINDIRYKDTY